MKLSAVNVNKNFIRSRGDSNIFCAVAESNLELQEGTLTALTGPSGSGKSTFLNMLAGLLPPSSGKVLLDDIDLYQQNDKELSMIRNRHIGMIPQGQTALQALTVLENVLVPYLLYRKNGKDRAQILQYAEELMKKADIWDLKNEMPSELSGGELRRVAVCRALLLKPEIILADEPTGDLDEENTAIVMGMLKNCAENNATVFVVTHDKQVWEYADKILEMKKGIISVSNCEQVNILQKID